MCIRGIAGLRNKSMRLAGAINMGEDQAMSLAIRQFPFEWSGKTLCVVRCTGVLRFKRTITYQKLY